LAQLAILAFFPSDGHNQPNGEASKGELYANVDVSVTWVEVNEGEFEFEEFECEFHFIPS